MKKGVLIGVLILGLNSILPIVSEVQALTKTEQIESVENSNNDVLGRLERLAKSNFVNLKEVKRLQDEIKILFQEEKETISLATNEKRQKIVVALEKLEKAEKEAKMRAESDNSEDDANVKKESEEAEPEAKEASEEAEPEAKEAGDEAEPEAKETSDEAEPEAKETGDEAEPEAKETSEEAESEAKETSDEAEPEAKETSDEAESEVKEASDEAESEVKEASDEAESEAKEAGDEAELEAKEAGDEAEPEAKEASEEVESEAKEKLEKQVDLSLTFKSYDYAGTADELNNRVKQKIKNQLLANDRLMAEYKNQAGVTNERLTSTLAKADMSPLVKTLSKHLEGDVTLQVKAAKDLTLQLHVKLTKKLAVLGTEIVPQDSYVGYTTDAIDPEDFFEGGKVVINGETWTKVKATSPKDETQPEGVAVDSWDHVALFRTKDEDYQDVRVVLQSGKKTTEITVPVRFEIKKGSVIITDKILDEPSEDDKILLVLTVLGINEHPEISTSPTNAILKVGYGDAWEDPVKPPLIFDPNKSDYKPIGDNYFSFRGNYARSSLDPSGRDYFDKVTTIDGAETKEGVKTRLKNVREIRTAINNTDFGSQQNLEHSVLSFMLSTPNVHKVSETLGDGKEGDFSFNTRSRYRVQSGEEMGITQLSDEEIKKKHLIQLMTIYKIEKKDNDLIFSTVTVSHMEKTKIKYGVNSDSPETVIDPLFDQNISLPDIIDNDQQSITLTKDNYSDYKAINREIGEKFNNKIDLELSSVYYDAEINPTGLNKYKYKVNKKLEGISPISNETLLTAINPLDNLGLKVAKTYYTASYGRVYISMKPYIAMSAPTMVLRDVPSFEMKKEIKLTNRSQKVNLVEPGSKQNKFEIEDLRHTNKSSTPKATTPLAIVEHPTAMTVSTTGFYKEGKDKEPVNLAIAFEKNGQEQAVISSDTPDGQLKFGIKGDETRVKKAEIKFLSEDEKDSPDAYRAYLKIPENSLDNLTAGKYQVDLTYTLPSGNVADLATGTPEKVGA